MRSFINIIEDITNKYRLQERIHEMIRYLKDPDQDIGGYIDMGKTLDEVDTLSASEFIKKHERTVRFGLFKQAEQKQLNLSLVTFIGKDQLPIRTLLIKATQDKLDWRAGTKFALKRALEHSAKQYIDKMMFSYDQWPLVIDEAKKQIPKFEEFFKYLQQNNEYFATCLDPDKHKMDR